MRVRLALGLVAVTAAVAVISAACAPSKPASGGGGSPTATATTPVTPTPTPPLVPFEAISSWTDGSGSEIWLCFQGGVPGTLVNIRTTGPTACSSSSLGVSLAMGGGTASTIQSIRMDDPGLNCSKTASHHWAVDLVFNDDPGCPTGPCFHELSADLTANAPFGGACSQGGVDPFGTITAHRAATNTAFRFTLTVQPQVTELTVTGARLYSATEIFIADCTAGVTLAGSTSSATFDAICATAPALTVGGSYNALVTGKIGTEAYSLFEPFGFTNPPN